MEQEESELVYRVLEQVRKIETHEQAALLSIGESMSLLKSSKVWKGYYPEAKSWRSFLVASGLSPQSIDISIRIADRFGPILSKEDGLQVVTSRLRALLSIKHESQAKDLELIQTMAVRDVPHAHFKASLDAVKGKISPSGQECNHINLPEGVHNKREQWVKHTCCNTWQLID